MREIKFRAWHKTVHTMTSVAVIDFQQEELCEEYTYFPEADWHSLSCYDLMQFTGLLDKHGKEIFEGDIVRHQDISWGTYEEVVKYEQGLWNYSSGIVSGSRCQKPHIHWEIIGNIYENKDLLPIEA